MSKILKIAESIGTVHTHTHTHTCNLKNKKINIYKDRNIMHISKLDIC